MDVNYESGNVTCPIPNTTFSKLTCTTTKIKVSIVLRVSGFKTQQNSINFCQIIYMKVQGLYKSVIEGVYVSCWALLLSGARILIFQYG